MTLNELQELCASDEFHHATYRNFGTLWEGLWIYVKDRSPRGFDSAGVFLKGSAELPAAEALLTDTGISVGSYGHG